LVSVTLTRKTVVADEIEDESGSRAFLVKSEREKPRPKT
jgi:hypothetical protein